MIYAHLSGQHTVGIYPLLSDDTRYFVAVDFDEADWREDALAFIASCRTLEVPASLEVSRSGNSAHVWIFFESAVPARDARRLATAIISHVCTRTRQLRLTSYDRLFPNQDTLPKGGYGNLIALLLQRGPREAGWSVSSMRPYRASGGGQPLDVMFVSPEEADEPWVHRPQEGAKLPGTMPKVLDVTLANMIFLKKSQFPQPLANRPIRLAAFQNPEFYRAQAMRFAAALIAPGARASIELLKQWSERLRAFLRLEEDAMGTIVGGKSRPTGKLDIAVMQSLSRKGEVSDLVANYGHVIVDECHHVSAYSFESILKRVQARYVPV